MAATLLALVLTALVEAVVTGVAVVLALSLLWVSLTLTTGVPTIAVLLVVALVAVATLALVVYGERKAPAHTVALLGATPVDADDRPELRRLVRAVAQQADTPVPALYVTPSRTPLSLTTGFRPGSSRLVLSEGLLERLDEAELEAVVAHEVAHVKNRDTAVLTAAALPVGAAGRVFDLLSGPTTGVQHGTASRADLADGLVTVGLLFAAPVALCTFLLWASLSRSREFTADRAATALTGNPAALASALRRIDRAFGDRPSTDLRRTEVAAFAIAEPGRVRSDGSNRLGRLPLAWLFDTHPSIDERIDRLRRRSRTQERGE